MSLNLFTRICWNDNGWVKPSGPSGKSTDENSYECSPGFGYEEWLFNEAFSLDGFQYGKIQGAEKININNYLEQARLYLYTKKIDCKKYNCIGYIDDIVFIQAKESDHFFNEKKEIENIIYNDLLNIGFNKKDAKFYSGKRDVKFNLKFKMDNLILFEKYINMPDNFSFSRYLIIKNKEKTDYYLDHIKKLFSDEVKSNLPYGISSCDVGETEREAIIKQRTKQTLFRNRLFSMWGACCAVTNININELIIASHIKPWSECNNDERIDAANGVPLCTHIDKLFDKHLVTFFLVDDNWILSISDKLDKEKLSSIGINDGDILSVNLSGEYLSNFKKYMKLHNEKYNRLLNN